MSSGRAPHYIRDYRRLLQTLKRRHPVGDEALHRAVGGSFDQQGRHQAKLVMSLAPKGKFNLIDVGCGAGRAASVLRDIKRLSYFGVDILPELLDNARKVARRPDWRFELVTDIALPAEDGWADIALIMSVFTHLKTEEIERYLGEAARVVKPGGAIICSYLDRSVPGHRRIVRPAPLRHVARLIGRDVLVSFTTREEMSQRLEAAGFAIERTIAENPQGQHILIGRRCAEAQSK